MSSAQETVNNRPSLCSHDTINTRLQRSWFSVSWSTTWRIILAVTLLVVWYGETPVDRISFYLCCFSGAVWKTASARLYELSISPFQFCLSTSILNRILPPTKSILATLEQLFLRNPGSCELWKKIRTSRLMKFLWRGFEIVKIFCETRLISTPGFPVESGLNSNMSGGNHIGNPAGVKYNL